MKEPLSTIVTAIDFLLMLPVNIPIAFGIAAERKETRVANMLYVVTIVNSLVFWYLLYQFFA